MPVGTIFHLALGAILVAQSPSLRERLVSRLSSTGLKMFATQEGLATAEKSVLLAVDIQLSTLHDPTSEMSAASTAKAPLAARASPDANKAEPAVIAKAMRIPISPMRKG
jgi:hypothetical protein